MSQLPTVTEILRTYQDFANVEQIKLKSTAQRGTAVHKACTLTALCLFVPDMTDEIKPYHKSFLIWFNSQVSEVLAVEEEFCDPYFGYRGHPDLVVILNDETRAVVDLKTPATKNRLWALQLAAYKQLVRNKFEINRVGSLRLSFKGDVPKMDWYENVEKDFTVFLNAVNIYRYLNLNNKRR